MPGYMYKRDPSGMMMISAYDWMRRAWTRDVVGRDAGRRVTAGVAARHHAVSTTTTGDTAPHRPHGETPGYTQHKPVVGSNFGSGDGDIHCFSLHLVQKFLKCLSERTTRSWFVEKKLFVGDQFKARYFEWILQNCYANSIIKLC